MKPIYLSAHALDQVSRRGFTPDEVERAIQTAAWQPAARGRLECNMEFEYNDEWNGRHYAIKQVRPIFVEEAERIVVVTVYTYFY